MVFFNDKSLDITVSEEFTTMWDEIEMPGSIFELERDLERNGLKGMQVVKAKAARPQASSGRKKGGRSRAKITNSHLAGFADLKRPDK
jgi:hypothetical protein